MQFAMLHAMPGAQNLLGIQAGSQTRAGAQQTMLTWSWRRQFCRFQHLLQMFQVTSDAVEPMTESLGPAFKVMQEQRSQHLYCLVRWHHGSLPAAASMHKNGECAASGDIVPAHAFS